MFPQDVVSRMKQKPIVLAGKTTLAQVTALDWQSRRITTLTSARRTRSPTLVIFGLESADYSALSPLAKFDSRRLCPMHARLPTDHRCMTAITVEEVFDRAFCFLIAKN